MNEPEILTWSREFLEAEAEVIHAAVLDDPSVHQQRLLSFREKYLGAAVRDWTEIRCCSYVDDRRGSPEREWLASCPPRQVMTIRSYDRDGMAVYRLDVSTLRHHDRLLHEFIIEGTPAALKVVNHYFSCSCDYEPLCSDCQGLGWCPGDVDEYDFEALGRPVSVVRLIVPAESCHQYDLSDDHDFLHPVSTG